MIKVSLKITPVFDAFQIDGDSNQHECLIESPYGLVIEQPGYNVGLLVRVGQWVILQDNKVFAVIDQKDFDECFQQV